MLSRLIAIRALQVLHTLEHSEGSNCSELSKLTVPTKNCGENVLKTSIMNKSLHKPSPDKTFLGTWPHWAGGWDQLDSYLRMSLLSRLALSRQNCDLASGHHIRGYLPVTVVFD